MTKEYVRPTVEELGSFEEITQAAVNGSALDTNEPSGTPISELTFS